MSEEGAGAMKQFALRYAKVVAYAFAIPIAVVGFATAATVLLMWPSLVGAYVELGHLPWELFLEPPEANVSPKWYAAIVVWWVFGLTAIYAGVTTIREVRSDD